MSEHQPQKHSLNCRDKVLYSALAVYRAQACRKQRYNGPTKSDRGAYSVNLLVTAVHFVCMLRLMRWNWQHRRRRVWQPSDTRLFRGFHPSALSYIPIAWITKQTASIKTQKKTNSANSTGLSHNFSLKWKKFIRQSCKYLYFFVIFKLNKHFCYSPQIFRQKLAAVQTAGNFSKNRHNQTAIFSLCRKKIIFNIFRSNWPADRDLW